MGVEKIKRYITQQGAVRGVGIDEYATFLTSVAVYGLSSDNTPDDADAIDFDDRDVMPAVQALEALFRKNNGQRTTWQEMQAAIDSARQVRA